MKGILTIIPHSTELIKRISRPCSRLTARTATPEDESTAILDVSTFPFRLEPHNDDRSCELLGKKKKTLQLNEGEKGIASIGREGRWGRGGDKV